MKILILTNLFVPFTRGGAERIVELQAKLLAESGHDVLVLSTTPTGQFASTTLDNGVRVHRFKPKNFYHTLKDTYQPFWKRILWHLIDLFSGQSYKLVQSALKNEQPDLVITHNLKGFGLGAAKALSESKVRHIHVLHDLQLVVPSGLKIYEHESSWMVSGRLQKWYVKKVSEKFGSPDLIVSPSQYLLEEHESAGLFPKSKTQVMQNPAPWDDLGFRSVTLSESPLVLYVGQIDEHKGLKILMDAWQKKGMGANLGIVGTGALEDEVRKFADEHDSVTYYGRKSPSEVRTFMSRASVLVVPSLCYENSPTVIMEALSVGTPVIASNIGGISELVEERDGTLVEPGDTEALREAIKKLIASNPDREDIKSRASRFSVERYKKDLIKLIEK